MTNIDDVVDSAPLVHAGTGAATKVSRMTDETRGENALKLLAVYCQGWGEQWGRRETQESMPAMKWLCRGERDAFLFMAARIREYNNPTIIVGPPALDMSEVMENLIRFMTSMVASTSQQVQSEPMQSEPMKAIDFGSVSDYAWATETIEKL